MTEARIRVIERGWTGVEYGIQRRSNPRTATRCPRGLESGIRALTGTSGISGVDVQNIIERQKGQKGKEKKVKTMTRLGLDPRTLSVLTIRDNQLHHPANC